jgi:bacillithiol biosynthesis cysteine-adding enzyme BshC
VTPQIDTLEDVAAPRLTSARLAGRRGLAVDPELEPAFLAAGAAKNNLHRLFKQQALCVTTGQQPGLFTGPLYTVHKAMAAIALARQLETQLGEPVVPVFWVAGDDHDFVESSRANILTVRNDIESLTLSERASDAPARPMYREPLGEAVATALQSLVAATPDTEFKDVVLELVKRHYRPDADVATAFSGMLSEMLGRFGLLVFRPYHLAAKRVAAPLVLRAIHRAADAEAALDQRAAQLRDADRPAPIKVGTGTTTVMLEAELGRDRLVMDAGSFRTRRSGEQYSVAQLEEIALNEPMSLSPNVLLRPVIQAGMLPTLAYVAGPGELAYLPQADPLYALLNVEPQQLVGRWAGVILERRILKVLDKFGISAAELSAPVGQLEGRLVRDEMPEDAADAISKLRTVLSAEYQRLASAAITLDPTLAKPIGSEEHNALRRLGDLEKKIVGQLKKQNTTVAEQLAKARVNLYPLGRPQERVLNVLPYLIRYGEDLLDGIRDRCFTWAAALETSPSHR